MGPRLVESRAKFVPSWDHLWANKGPIWKLDKAKIGQDGREMGKIGPR